MLFSDRILLVEADSVQDDIGNLIPSSTPALREVFADLQSVGRAEFFAAAQSGLKPEIRAVVHAEEYRGEREAQLGGERYTVYRSYTTGDKTELYLTRKAGRT